MRGGDAQCVGLANFHSVNTLIMTDFKLLMKVPEHVTTEKCMSAIKSVPGTRGLMFVPCLSPLLTGASCSYKSHTLVL